MTADILSQILSVLIKITVSVMRCWDFKSALGKHHRPGLCSLDLIVVSPIPVKCY